MESTQQRKTCRQCSNIFEVTEEDLQFYDKISPVFNEKKYQIPPPTLCSDCRQQRRIVQRNQNKLYRRKCDFTGEDMISLYSEDKPFKVYQEGVWWSDKWDPMEYGREFDFNRPFFEQFNELQSAVPRCGMHQDGTNENCEYITFGFSNKNCYLAFACLHCEDVYYSSACIFSKNCTDCLLSLESELCYECTDCKKCYECLYCQDSISCSDSIFLQDCRNCHHCIGCKNLRNKEYHIYNKPVSKEEFEAFKKRLIDGGLLKEKEKYDKWKLQLPFIYARIIQSENSSGDYLENAKNCHDCFDILMGSEDCKHCQYAGGQSKDMMDCTMAGKESELIYEMIATVNTYKSAFSNHCRNGSNVYYCTLISESKDCFGCIGINHKQYCILNKQYTKEEYEKLVPRIIEHMQKTGEWGEFFPASTSTFAYNETLAQEYFPLTKEEALAKNYKWKDEDQKSFQPQTYKIPKSINEVPDSVINETFACTDCKQNYKIIPQELKFYRKLGIPLPPQMPRMQIQSTNGLKKPKKAMAPHMRQMQHRNKNNIQSGKPGNRVLRKVLFKRGLLKKLPKKPLEELRTHADIK